MNDLPFIIEEKYDGERITIHKMKGNKYKFITRNGSDYTKHYLDCLKEYLDKLIIPNEIILDGEMLGWNEKTNAFTLFGSNRTIALEQKKYLQNIRQGKECKRPTQWLCYAIFDVVYCDKNFNDYPLWSSNYSNKTSR